MEQIKALIEKAKSDDELMAKINALGEKDSGTEEIIVLAKEYGFIVTAEEIEKAKSGEGSTRELKEEDLEAVAGGGLLPTQNRYDKNTCKGMKRMKYECVGVLSSYWCDHFKKKHDPNTPSEGFRARYFMGCRKGAFLYYRAEANGTPAPGR